MIKESSIITIVNLKFQLVFLTVQNNYFRSFEIRFRLNLTL